MIAKGGEQWRESRREVAERQRGAAWRHGLETGENRNSSACYLKRGSGRPRERVRPLLARIRCSACTGSGQTRAPDTWGRRGGTCPRREVDRPLTASLAPERFIHLCLSSVREQNQIDSSADEHENEVEATDGSFAWDRWACPRKTCDAAAGGQTW